MNPMKSTAFIAILLILTTCVIIIQAVTSATKGFDFPPHSLNFQKPISTRGSIFLNNRGQRIKFTCAVWPAHLESYLPEGLSLANISVITGLIPRLNLNCILFTVSIEYTLKPNVTGRQMASSVGLSGTTISGIDLYNPGLLDLNMTQIYGKVFDSLSKVGVMVIIDNMVSKAGWCCSSGDVDGWPGTGTFIIQDWLNGLKFLANTFGPRENVVGIGIRNKPRGSNDASYLQSVMRQGALAVHSVNKDLLILVSSISNNFTFEMNNPLGSTFSYPIITTIRKKLVYYGSHFPNDVVAVTGINQEQICITDSNARYNNMFRVMELGYPFVISGWGFSPYSFDGKDPWFLCLFVDMIRYDISSSFWQLIPQYYIKQGILDYGESMTLSLSDFSDVVSASLNSRFQILQPFLLRRDRKPYFPQQCYVIFHPQSARCLVLDDLSGDTPIAPCDAYGDIYWKINPSDSTQLIPCNPTWDALLAPDEGYISLVSLVGPVAYKVVLVNGIKLTYLGNDGVTYCPTSSVTDVSTIEYVVSTEVCNPDSTNDWFFLL